MYPEFGKRLIDVVAVSIGLVVLSPLLLLVALLIRLESSGPAFFIQERMGKDGKPFRLVKFRSMTHNPDRDVRKQVRTSSPEVTRLGRWLRRTKIDELPQLWNVLKGEMAVVGPRPALPGDLETYTPRQRGRLVVKPGLTCIAQLRGSSYLTWDERIEYDLEYCGRMSLALDISIIWGTLAVMLFGEKRYIQRHPHLFEQNRDSQ